MYQTCINTPIGPITLRATDTGLCGLYFGGEPGTPSESPILQKAVQQLQEYFAGERKAFELPLDRHGTGFQEKVWQELEKIPYGQTISYGELARRGGNPKASRAVGMANNRNPIGLIVPCHRVVGSKGALVGYAGGLDLKRSLLQHEGVVVA